MKCGIVDCIKPAPKNELYCQRHKEQTVNTPYGKYTLNQLEKMDLNSLIKMTAKSKGLSSRKYLKKLQDQAEYIVKKEASVGSEDEDEVEGDT